MFARGGGGEIRLVGVCVASICLSLTLSTLYSFTHSLSSLSRSQRKQHWCLAAQIGSIHWHTKHNETTAWQPPAQSFTHTQTQKVPFVRRQTCHYFWSQFNEHPDVLITQLIDKILTFKWIDWLSKAGFDSTEQTCKSASISASKLSVQTSGVTYDDAWLGGSNWGIRQWCHSDRQKKTALADLNWRSTDLKSPQNPAKTSQKTSKPAWFKVLGWLKFYDVYEGISRPRVEGKTYTCNHIYNWLLWQLFIQLIG